jgi:hypothetical protein
MGYDIQNNAMHNKASEYSNISKTDCVLIFPRCVQVFAYAFLRTAFSMLNSSIRIRKGEQSHRWRYFFGFHIKTEPVEPVRKTYWLRVSSMNLQGEVHFGDMSQLETKTKKFRS